MLTTLHPTYIHNYVIFFKTKVEKNTPFSTDLFKNYPPTRTGYRFKGVRVEVGNFSQDFSAKENVSVDKAYITGTIKITLLWEKEFSVTSDNAELSTAFGDLKAYEGNDFKFPGFGGLRGYTIPTKPEFKFRGVRVQIGSREEEHLGMDAFTISKENITDTITMTLLWDEQCPVKFLDGAELEPILKDLKIYKDTDLSFNGFGGLLAGAYGYDVPKKLVLDSKVLK
jgi:hypothetical protein